MYYNVPASHLIFLTKADHTKIHRLNIHIDESTKEKMSQASKQRQPSKNTKQKISLSMKRHHRTNEHCKNISISKQGSKNPTYGKKCYNNGVINVFAKTCPEGFKLGRLNTNKL